MASVDADHCYSFPAIRGIQAGRPSTLPIRPMRIIPKIFSFDENDVLRSCARNAPSINLASPKWFVIFLKIPKIMYFLH